MRRSLLSLIGALVLIVVGSTPAFAVRDATPTSGLADLGLPTLDVTVTASGFEGIPDTLAAGRYLVTVTATAEVDDFGGGVSFVSPAGMSAEAFLDMLSGAVPEGDEAASPVTDAAASPAVEEGGDGLPAVIFESTHAGGVYVMPGQTSEVVLDLPPGEWIAWNDNSGAQEPVIFEATGEMPAELPEPESGATVTMDEYTVEVTGALAAGTQVVRIDNTGDQPHFIYAVKGPDGLTEDQIQTILDEEMAAEMTGTPADYSDLNPEEDLEDVFFTAVQSSGASVWLPISLEAGAHVLICFFPDQEDGIPHAYHGMFTVVEVGGA